MAERVKTTAVVSLLLVAVGFASVSAAVLGGVFFISMLALDGPSWEAAQSGLFLVGGLTGYWGSRNTFDGLPNPTRLPRLAVAIGAMTSVAMIWLMMTTLEGTA